MSSAPGGARVTRGEASGQNRVALSGRLDRREGIRRAAGLGALASASAALKVSPRAAAQGTPVATPGVGRLRLGAVFNLTGEQSSLDVLTRDGRSWRSRRSTPPEACSAGRWTCWSRTAGPTRPP